ncbi:hypothetical protein [Cupriavidus sp. UYPR2.512]|uniref:hypothetical protein n=1 Tax=Cupriavidus sp. UYPR2.512 TaxID=1080187 RepID=UPI0012F92371|nr:hypothetical protein [Cupriavidus sp. UYPR2.512]UIF89196.1 hypothetical protein KAF44_29900 [Cupriavidus necator]
MHASFRGRYRDFPEMRQIKMTGKFENAMGVALSLYQELVAAWRSTAPDLPAQLAQPLLTRATRTVYLEDSWGPAVPYFPIHHEDGSKNHGYSNVKAELNLIDLLPEVHEYPELANFLKTINAAGSPIESLGCEKLLQETETPTNGVRAIMSSYVDVAFSDPSKVSDASYILWLAALILAASEGCEQWWASMELGVLRLRSFLGVTKPYGLLIRVSCAGRTAAEARDGWAATLQVVASVAKLPAAAKLPGE